MQVFNLFFKIAKKQLPSGILYIVIFMTFLGILSSVGGTEEVYTESRVDIAIFNRDESAKSKYLEEYLGSIHDIVEVEDNDEVILDYLYYQVLDYVLYIDEDYKLTNIKRPGSTYGTYVDNHIAVFGKTYDSYILAGYSESEAYDKTLEAISNDNLVSFKGESASRPALYYFYNYSTYILLALLLTVLAPIIIEINKKEVKNRYEISPNTIKKRSIQIIGATIILSFAMWLLMLVMGFIIYGGKLFEEINALNILNLFSFLIVSVSIVSIVSNFNLNANAISMVSNVVGLSFAFLGGVFVPLEIFGEGMLKIAKCVPTYWFVNTNGLIFDGNVTTEMFFGMIVQLLFALAFFAISLVISKQKRAGVKA